LFLFAKICIFAAILYFLQSWQRGGVRAKMKIQYYYIFPGIGEMLSVKIDGFSTENFTPVEKGTQDVQ
jgi:hypothetical protein